MVNTKQINYRFWNDQTYWRKVTAPCFSFAPFQTVFLGCVVWMTVSFSGDRRNQWMKSESFHRKPNKSKTSVIVLKIFSNIRKFTLKRNTLQRVKCNEKHQPSTAMFQKQHLVVWKKVAPKAHRKIIRGLYFSMTHVLLACVCYGKALLG